MNLGFSDNENRLFSYKDEEYDDNSDLSLHLEHLQEFAISTWHPYNFGKTKKTSNSLAKQLGINSNLANLPSARVYGSASRAPRFLAGLFVRLAGLFIRLAGFFYFTKLKIPNSLGWIAFLLGI